MAGSEQPCLSTQIIFEFLWVLIFYIFWTKNESCIGNICDIYINLYEYIMLALSRCMGWLDMRDIQYLSARGIEIYDIDGALYNKWKSTSSAINWALNERLNFGQRNGGLNMFRLNRVIKLDIDVFILELFLSYTSLYNLCFIEWRAALVAVLYQHHVVEASLLLAYGVKFIRKYVYFNNSLFQDRNCLTNREILLTLYGFSPYEDIVPGKSSTQCDELQHMLMVWA